MKRKNAIAFVLIILLVLSVTVTGCKSDKALTDDEQMIMEYIPKVSSGYYKSLLTDEKETELYEELLRAVITHDTEYDVKHFDTDTVNKVSLYLTLDNPFIVLSDNLIEYSVTHDYDSRIIDWLTEFDVPFSMEYENMTDEILESIHKAEEIIASMPVFEDEYHTAKYLHDYLATSVYYSSDEETTPYHCTPYAALIQGSGKCESYSRAYALLCNMAGLECFMVMYDQDQSEDGVGHMWNMVKVNGSYYYVDVTHDSFTQDIGYPRNYIAYDYFLVDKSSLSTPDLLSESIRDIVPEVTDDKDTFFVKNSLIFEKYDRNTVGSAAGKFLKAQKEEGYCGVSIKFTDKKDYDKALKKAEFQKLLYVISQNDGYGAKSYNYGTNDKQLIIRIHPISKENK